jgi:hypothetical protein
MLDFQYATTCVQTSAQNLRMKISNHVDSALIDWEAGRLESALTHALIAVDGTARRMFPKLGNAERYKRCLRHFYWIIEPALGAGIKLEATRFSNIQSGGLKDPDFADIVYKVFRCAHAHGDEVPLEFELTRGHSGGRMWTIGDGVLNLPHTLIFALLFVAVFAPVNKDERPIPGAWLTLGAPESQDSFPISEWWGRSADLQPIAAKHNAVRVTFEFPPGHQFSPNGPTGEIIIDLRPKPDTADVESVSPSNP